MANTNSAIITQLGSSQGKQSVRPDQLGGRVRVSMGTVAVAAVDFDANNDTVVLTRLPGNARLTSLRIAADDLGAEEADLGLYVPGGAAKIKDVYIDDIDLDTAATPITEVLGRTRDINEMGQRVFEDAGDTQATALPFYDLVLTRVGTAGTEQDGDVSFIVEYVID